jgi:hypothetical protein
MDVPNELQKVRVLLAEHGFVSIPEEMTRPTMAEVEAHAVAGQNPLHALTERSPLAPDDEVEVISHEDKREQPQILLLDNLRHTAQKVLPIPVRTEDGPAFHATSDHVVEAIHDVDARPSRHESLLAAR